jgi:hypothetical protein
MRFIHFQKKIKKLLDFFGKMKMHINAFWKNAFKNLTLQRIILRISHVFPRF